MTTDFQRRGQGYNHPYIDLMGMLDDLDLILAPTTNEELKHNNEIGLRADREFRAIRPAKDNRPKLTVIVNEITPERFVVNLHSEGYFRHTPRAIHGCDVVKQVLQYIDASNRHFS